MKNIDRLSVLPDDIIHKILSSFNTKHIIQLCVLSSRWRFRWTSMPYLHISTRDFDTSPKFSEFVNRLLSGRNDNIHVYSLKLTYHRMYCEVLLQKILNYAFSHNVERLDVTCLLSNKVDFPLDHFRSEYLKHLSLTGKCRYSSVDPYTILLASTWDLSALTTLRLDHVSFSGVDLFSKCSNLKSLYLNNYKVMESDNFTLCHPRLMTLKLYDALRSPNVLNVVAPQLKKLVILSCYGKHVITAPNLSSLIFNDEWFCGLLEFSTDLPFLKTVDLSLHFRDKWSGCRIAALLQQLRNVKFLQINLEFLKPLISYMEQIPLQPSPFSNLKRLKIYPAIVPSDDEAHKRIHLTSKVIEYFLDGSPNAIFTLVSYEET